MEYLKRKIEYVERLWMLVKLLCMPWLANVLDIYLRRTPGLVSSQVLLVPMFDSMK